MTQFTCPPLGDEDPPNSASTRPVNRTSASTPGGDPPSSAGDPQTPSIKPIGCRSEDESRTPAPVLARTHGLFGDGKDQGSVKRRMAATGTMAATNVPNSASNRPDHSASSIFKSARSTAMNSLNRFTGTKKTTASGETPSRGNRDAEFSRNLEVIRDLTIKVEQLETENEALKKDKETMKGELVRRARVIMQQSEQNAKLSKDVAQVTSLKQPREILWSYRQRDASLGGDGANGEGDFDGTPSSRARRASGEYKPPPRRRGLSLTRADCGDEDEAKNLKQRVQELLLEQEKLKTTNQAVQTLIQEAESTLFDRQHRVDDLMSQLQDLEAKVEVQSSKLAELEEKIGAARKELEEIEEHDIKSREDDIRNLEEKRDKLNSETEKIIAEQEQIKSVTADLLAKKEALAESKARLEKEQKEKEDMFTQRLIEFEAKYSDEALSTNIATAETLQRDIEQKTYLSEELSRKLDKLGQDITAQTEKLALIEKESDQAEQRNATALQELESSLKLKREEEKKVVDNMTHAQDMIVKAQGELSRLESERIDLQKKLGETSVAADAAQKRLEQLNSEEKSIKDAILKEKADIQVEMTKLNDQLTSLRNEVKTLQSTIASLSEEEQSTRTAKNRLEKEVSDLQQSLQSLNTQRDRTEQDCQRLESDRQRLESDRQRLESDLTSTKTALEADIEALNIKLAEESAKQGNLTRVETTDSKSKRSVSTIPGSTDRSEVSERSDDFRGVPVESVETFLSSPEELSRIKSEILKVTNVLKLRQEELTAIEKNLGDLHQRRQQEALACDKLRDSVKQLEELRQTRETEFRSLTDKCDELTRQIEELRATESAMGPDRSRTSSRGLSLEKDDLMRGLHMKDECWFGLDKSLPEPEERLSLETQLFNLREVHKERNALRDVIVHLEKQKFSLIETIKTLQEEVDDAHTNLSVLRTEIAEGTSKLASLRSDLASATAALQMIRDEHVNSKKLLAATNEARDKCDSEVSAFRNSLAALRRERDQLQRSVEQLKEERVRVEEGLKLLEGTKETEVAKTHLEDEVRRMREAATAERRELSEKIEAAREEFTVLNDQIRQRQMDEQARMARVEEDRVRSRQHFEAAMKDAETELKSLQNQVATARANVREELEAETRTVRVQKETELRDLQAKIAECENQYKQIRAKVRSQVKLVGRSSLDWVRQAAEHVVAEVILDDIDGLEQDNNSAARLEAKVLDKIRTLQAERALSPSSGQPPWASPLSPATHPRFHPGSPVWQRSVEWQGRRASHDGRHPLALFEQRPSVQTSPPPMNLCGDSVTQNSTQESLPHNGEFLKEFPLDSDETARILADNAALRTQIMQLHRRLGEAEMTNEMS